MFFRYRLTVYAFPLFAIVGYVLLARFGPLRARGPRPAKRTIELVEPVPTARPTPERASWGALARVLLPAVVVVTACGTRTGHLDLIAVAAGVVYAALVAAVAEVWARRTDGQRGRALSAVNGVGGAVAAVLSLWFVSAHTVVQTATGTRSWPWLAWWLPVLGVVAIGWWAARQLRGGRAARDVELTLLTVVVGAIALFLAMSMLPGPISHFEGFDDALDMGGANTLAHGYFPWRDLLFYHGVFRDVLAGSLGRAIFDDSIWGITAGHTVILDPTACGFNLPLRRLGQPAQPVVPRPVLAGCDRSGDGVAAGVGAVHGPARAGAPAEVGAVHERSPRVEQPGGAVCGLAHHTDRVRRDVRRRSAGWAVGLTLLLVVEEILVPETIFSPRRSWRVWWRRRLSIADRGRTCGPVCGSPAGASAPGSPPRPYGRRS